MPTLDFTQIRPQRGSANIGFEELCCQLAAHEPMPDGSHFVRNGTPDGGVEAFWKLPTGKLLGWQAKYFFDLKHSQWKDIDDSVQTALDAYPELSRYTVCLPINLPSGRKPRQKSLRDKWNDRVKKWEAFAASRRMNVLFDLWDETAILNRLTQDIHAGRRWYWFSKTELSPAWFTAHLEEVRAAAGPRYNKDLNVKSPIALSFEALGYTSEFQNKLHLLERSFGKQFELMKQAVVRRDEKRQYEQECNDLFQASENLATLLKRIRDIAPCQSQSVCLEKLAEEIQSLIGELLYSMEKSSESEKGFANQQIEAYRAQEPREIVDFRRSVQEVHEFSSMYSSKLAIKPALLISGQAGIGKTHLMCNVAEKRNTIGLPTIMLLGHQIKSPNIWRSITERLEVNCTREELLGALESAAEVSGGRALIFLDAINEATDINWRDELPALLSVLSRWPRIGIAVSCRTTYEKLMVRSDLVPKQLMRIKHDGFASTLFSALAAFCAYYRIEALNTPPLNPEFENPLFLKLFCEGLRNRNLTRPPRGQHGLHRVFEFHLDSVNEKLASPSELDFSEQDRIVHKAINVITDAMLTENKPYLTRDKATTILEVVYPSRSKGYSRSLLKRLIDEGILLEDLRWQRGIDSSEHVVFFGYQRLADYLIARRFLDRHLDIDDLPSSFSKRSSIAKLFTKDRIYQNQGLLAAMIVMIPEMTGHELGSLMPHLLKHDEFVHSFLETLPWRDNQKITPDAISFIDKLLECGALTSAIHSPSDQVYESLLQLASQPGSLLNARWLHSRLLSLDMPNRDLMWSTFLHRAQASRHRQGQSTVERLIDWAWQEDDELYKNYDDEVIFLTALTLTWFLSTSNRFVRDKATKALVCLLKSRLHLVPQLLAAFRTVNDLYVSERLYCAVYGAVLRSSMQGEIASIAETVYSIIFEFDPPAHVLLRDYAREIIEYAYVTGCVLNIDLTRIRPPYRSDPLPLQLPSWQELKSRYSSMRYYSLTSSLTPDWGDFARYVLKADSRHDGLHTWTHQKDPFANLRQIEASQAKLSKALTRKWHHFSHQELMDELDSVSVTDVTASQSEAFDSNEAAVIGHDDFKAVLKRFIATLGPLSRNEKTMLLAHLQDTAKYDEESKKAEEIREGQYSEPDFSSRWILLRVLELGWTPERFDKFDSEVDNMGRSARKAERIGKKYQWLAYHEYAARVFDHRPFHHESHSGTQQYDGPWLLSLRDIDPSILMKSVPDRDANACWWVPLQNPHLTSSELESHQWLGDDKSIPDFNCLFTLKRPSDGTSWLPLDLSVDWDESEADSQSHAGNHRRRVSVSLASFFIRPKDFTKLTNAMSLAEWGSSDIDTVHISSPFLGEFAWAPSLQDLQQDAASELGSFIDPNNSQLIDLNDSGVPAAAAVMQYLHEGRGFDCSLKESFIGHIPSIWFAKRADLTWSRKHFSFNDKQGRVVAFDPSHVESGARGFLISKEFLLSFIKQQKLAIVWLLIGEKILWSDRSNIDDKKPHVRVYRQIHGLKQDSAAIITRSAGYLGEPPIHY